MIHVCVPYLQTHISCLTLSDSYCDGLGPPFYNFSIQILTKHFSYPNFGFTYDSDGNFPFFFKLQEVGQDGEEAETSGLQKLQEKKGQKENEEEETITFIG